jgi:phenylalanyl-tRNA synthetase beta chain
LYNYVHIAWPVHYKAAIPESVRFAPLDMEKELNLREILEQHPKGQQYQGILNDMARYPVLTDSAGQVLSLVPIINSNFTGKLEVGSTSLMFEATGTDENAVDLAANIFAQNLHDRGFSISRATIDTGKRYTTPRSLNQKIRINPATVAQLTGLVLTKNQIRSRLEKARYGVQGPVVHVPHYRHDIMHITDVIEDIAIMHGFDKIESAPLQHYTLGAADAMVPFADAVREIGVGLGFQEVFSAVLSNKDMLYTRMNIKDTGTVEIENTMSETYAAVRSWLLPIMLEVLSKNKHVDYPQKVFEQGLVTERHGADARDGERIAFAISHTATDFTEIKQVLDAVLLAIGKEHTIIPIEHGSFISGRCGEVSVEGKKIAILGEIHPAVLVNWGLEMPVSALEINLTELKKLLSI